MERERENRRAEERNREEGGKDEGRGRGNARGGGEKVSRKGERRRGRWRRRQQHTKTRERGEEGRDRREEGRCTAQKLEGGSLPSDIMTGGAQGSDERGDRTAGERQNGGQALALIIYFFTNQIIYRRRGAHISGNSHVGGS